MVKESSEHLEEYDHLQSVLKNINDFVLSHQYLNYIEFDYYVVHNLNLFIIAPDFDFQTLKSSIDKINASLPAIKRIFSKPIINLIDSNSVLPVENVHIINQNTFLHLASHSESISNITSRGIKPRSLLTRVYEDDYSIYENIIFCNFIDMILHYFHYNMRSLKNLVYDNEIMQFNFLEKVNHSNYFLALGKLHTGYIRDLAKYRDISKELYNKFSHINEIINARLNKPIYQKNKIRNRNLSLKKTNIFIMQKDYHQIYATYKYFIKNDLAKVKINENIDLSHLKKTYFYYVLLLSIFSIGNFGFETNPNEKMDIKNINTSFEFKNWKINISTINEEKIIIDIFKEAHYKFLLYPSIDFSDGVDAGQNTYGTPIDEIIYCSPFENVTLDGTSIFLSIENIDSFRRIQQILLKGMVYADNERKICPFCGEKLSYNKFGNFYECENCQTQIKEGTCKETNKTFFYTDLPRLKKTIIDTSSYNKNNRWLYKRKIEDIMHYRNITKINEKGQIVCPFCKHKQKEEIFK